MPRISESDPLVGRTIPEASTWPARSECRAEPSAPNPRPLLLEHVKGTPLDGRARRLNSPFTRGISRYATGQTPDRYQRACKECRRTVRPGLARAARCTGYGWFGAGSREGTLRNADTFLIPAFRLQEDREGGRWSRLSLPGL